MNGEGKLENLKRFGKEIPNPTSEEARERGAKGGIASGEARRKKADILRSIDLLLSMPAEGSVRAKLIEMGYPEEELTNANAIVATLYAKGIMQGDQKAIETLINYAFQASDDERKTKESDARVAVMKGQTDIAVTSKDDDDGDVVIYLPKIEGEDDTPDEQQGD